MKQIPLTIITPVLADKQHELLDLLSELGLRVDHNDPALFHGIETIHYARWVVLQDFRLLVNQRPSLVFNINYDGTKDQLLQALCNKMPEVIDKIYEHCELYTPLEHRSLDSRIDYLRRYDVKASAAYIGAPIRTVKQILQENKLRYYIRAFLNGKEWKQHEAISVYRAAQEHVFSNPEFAWAKAIIKLPKINWLGLLCLGLVILILLPVLIPWILIVHFGYEIHDQNFTLRRSQLNAEQIKKLQEVEDIHLQNQFSQLVEMKSGAVRRITFKAMMALARGLIQYQFVKGKLLGIPTIHFAQWSLFDDNKRVLFFSNFDGSWQEYLGDFIDQSGWGLTGIFSNTKVFPKTNFLMTGGAYDEEHFLAWSRNSQIPTQVWFSAYPELSIKNINISSQIRYLLSKDLNEAEAQQFLRLI